MVPNGLPSIKVLPTGTCPADHSRLTCFRPIGLASNSCAIFTPGSRSRMRLSAVGRPMVPAIGSPANRRNSRSWPNCHIRCRAGLTGKTASNRVARSSIKGAIAARPPVHHNDAKRPFDAAKPAAAKARIARSG